MTVKKFQLLAMDVTVGAGYVRTPEGNLIAIYPSDPDGVPMTELEMETSITHPGFPYGFEDLREKGLFFPTIQDVRKELRFKRVYPVREPLTPQWDPKRNLMRFATHKQLERLLNRAFQEFIPDRKFTVALRIAEGMQYAKNTNLTLCEKASDVAMEVLASANLASEHKDVARNVLNIWEEKIEGIISGSGLYSWEDVSQFLKIAKKNVINKLLNQINESTDFKDLSERKMSRLEYYSDIVYIIKEGLTNKIGKTIPIPRDVIERLNDLKKLKDFGERYTVPTSIPNNKYGLGLATERRFLGRVHHQDLSLCGAME